MDTTELLWMILLTFGIFGRIILKLVNYILKKNGRKELPVREETTSINPNNPNDKPGRAQICIDNGLALERLETQMKEVLRRLNK